MFTNTLASWSRAEHPSLGYILTYFTRLSLWIPTRSRPHSLLHKALFAFVIAMFLNQVLYVALKQDMKAVLVFLQLLVYNIGVVKMLSYIVFYRQWNTVVTSVSEMELTFCLDSNCRAAVRKYSSHNRRLVAFVLLLTVLICVYTAPNRVYNQVKHLIRGEELSLERRFFYFCWPEPVAGLSGFLYILVEEMVCFSNVMYSVAWDILTTSCMATVAGLLAVVAVEFRQTLDEGTDEEKIKRLIKCYQLYQRIIETYKVSHRVVDPVLFMYLLMTSVNISITIISIKNTTSRLELLEYCGLMFGIVVQLFIYYWHGQMVITNSEAVSYSVFCSAWAACAAARRPVHAVGHAAARRLVYHAGPFNEVSLITFISILKFAYSFYTLITH
ncbi:uncharacterized protein LOC105383154 [Plutella xylostella]|uniref:uncharacterized protein LOC105383154 n=1 Tax=Plutella xylostella TaxID=51655 RepID=UPI002032EB65|nr:uncharacterized protein LOC105383154 [Plutella xylostella]